MLMNILYTCYGRYLQIYLKGDKENNGEGYISMYLHLEDESLPMGWEVHAIFNFFIYDQIQDKYLCLQGTCLYLYLYFQLLRIHFLTINYYLLYAMMINRYKRKTFPLNEQSMGYYKIP